MQCIIGWAYHGVVKRELKITAGNSHGWNPWSKVQYDENSEGVQQLQHKYIAVKDQIGVIPKTHTLHPKIKMVLNSDTEDYIDPYQSNLNVPNGGYGFDLNRDYLKPLPINELTLNENLTKNPSWE